MSRKKHINHRFVPIREVIQMKNYPFRHALAPIRDKVRYPTRKTAPDGYIQATKQTIKNLIYCYPRQNDVIWATVPRSGHNWLAMMYTIIAESLCTGEKINLDQVKELRPKYYRHTLIRYDLRDDDINFAYEYPIPRLKHTHLDYRPWMRGQKILLQIRHPQDVIISNYFHSKAYETTNFSDHIQSGSCHHLLNFYHRWDDAITHNRVEDVYVIRYEDLKQDTLTAVKNVMDFFELEVDTSLVHYAISETQQQKVQQQEMSKKNISDKRQLHLVRSGKINQTDSLTEQERTLLYEYLKNNWKSNSYTINPIDSI
jgi:hypothetical protein